MRSPLSIIGRIAACVAMASVAAYASEPSRPRFNVADFGAVADGRTLTTDRLQAAIDYAYASGGGTVVIPAGVFRSGSIFLKQGVALHLEKDAVLLGSNDIADYPKRNTRIEGHFEPWRMALINAENLTGLRISGAGKIDGNGILFWAAFWQRRKENPRCTNLEVERPRMFFIDRCTDVQISGLTLRDSGFWNVHLYKCQDVVIDGLDIASPTGFPIRAPSTDGIDIDSCQRIVVRHTTISVDDDCIALKGSKGPLADRDADSPPVEDIVIEHCTFGAGHGVVTLGSEATIVRKVVVRDCLVKGQNNLVRFKLRPDTPQLYEDIVYENIRLEGDGWLFQVRPWLQFFDPQGREPPPSIVRYITIRNVTGSYRTMGVLTGNKVDTLSDIRLENVNVQLADDKFEFGNVARFTTENVTVNGKPWSR